jgi:hypothetical protein
MHMKLLSAGPKPEPAARQPYIAPVLRVFGSITAVTSAIDMSGAVKDGGPNNIKT